jgi:ADP-heptose:LPS heptosyltransferase
MAVLAAAQLDLDRVHSVCIFCWGLIGDVLVRVPTIEALKRRYPHARFTVVVDPASRGALANHPYCDEIFDFSRRKRPVWNYLRGTVKNVLALRRRHFDMSVNLYSGGTSPRITRLVNARIRLGFDHTAALRRANNLHAKHPSLCDNWYKAFGTVLTPLGVAPESIRAGTSFYCTAAADQYAQELLGRQPNSVAAFNLGAGSADKRWSVDNYAALAHHVWRRHHLTPLVFTNPGMEVLAQEFLRACGTESPVIHAPLLSLDRVGAVMRCCACVVTGDTSLMHVAFGLKRPTLVLFTHTRPELVAPKDCVNVACFVEDPANIDAVCGRPFGTRDISVEFVAARFDELMTKIHGTNSSERSTTSC